MSDPGEFFLAVQRGDAPTVQRLLQTDANLIHATDNDGRTALHWTAEKDHAEVATVLLNAGADIEARTSWGASPLDWAAVLGSSNVANLLLARGASGLTLITAVSLGMISEVSPDHRIGRRPEGSSASGSAGRNGYTDVAAYLLDRGAVIDAKGVFGGTALHWAAINGKKEMVEFLVARGASLNLKDATFDATPEGWAREGSHEAIAAFLRSTRK